jgi:hypothetical protein
MKSIGAVRTYGFSISIRKYFDQVVVITTKNRHRISKDKYDLGGMRIIDTPTFDYRTIFNRRNNNNATISETTKKNKLYSKLSKLKASYPTNLLLGEGSYIYIYFAIKKASEIIRNENITHIFSSFSPFADHYIANRLKKKFPKVYWIADFRDLHVDPINHNTYLSEYQHRINKQILRDANIITTVSQGLAEHLKRYHDNIYILKNGIIPSEIPNKPIELFEKFTITYTGSMFSDKRNPDLLLAVIKDLMNKGILTEINFQLIYAGKDGGWWSNTMDGLGLSSILVNYGNIVREEAKHLQRKSHVNLLLTYTSENLKGNLTGKVYEYIASNRPILTIINGPFDPEMETILSHPDYLIGSTLKNNFRKKIEDFLIDKIEEWKSTNYVDFIPDENILEALSWPHLVKKFIKHLKLLP